MTLWKKSSFWQRIKDTIALFGTGGQVVLLLAEVPHLYNYITAAATALGMLVTLWFNDQDGDGNVDLFQDQTKTNI